MQNLLNKFKDFLKPKALIFYDNQETIAQSFGIPQKDFDHLTNDLVNAIQEDRILDLKEYLSSTRFKEYNLNPSNPNHAFIIGYAFNNAIVYQLELRQKRIYKQIYSVDLTSGRKTKPN